MKEKRAVVVGAGLGGLSAAAHLSKAGLDVTVLERNSYPGGYACSFVRDGFEFETSLHELSGIGPPENRGSCYRMLDKCDVAKRVEFLPIADFYTSVFPDFKKTIPHGWEAAEEAYCEQFPAEREGIKRALADMRGMSDALRAAQNMGPLDALTFPIKGRQVIRSTGLTTEEALSRWIKDQRCRALFTNIWGYYGLPPSRLSYQLFAIANASYLEYGPYHVKGTSQALSNAFVDAIEEHGGTVRLRDGATKIAVKNGKVTSVTTDSGETIKCDYVVCNANPIHTCYDLIGADNVPSSYLRSLAEAHIAVGTFNVYMGLDCPPSELGLTEHEFFINETYDWDASYDAGFEIKKPPMWVITCYNIADPDFSPPGTTVAVITVVCDGVVWQSLAPERYREAKNRMARELIDASEKYVPGLKDHLAVVEVSTPLTNMRYSGNPGGSILGFDFDVAGSPMFRLPNRGPLEGLYFGNAWVRMGGGFETAIGSGYLAFGEVMKDVQGVKGLKKLMPAFG
jgi:phytoene dehydrogenase-like protein